MRKPQIQLRYVTMLSLFLSSFVTDITRSDLNIAIVAMTEPVPVEQALDFCPHPEIFDEEQHFLDTGNFSYGLEHHYVRDEFYHRQYPWDQEVQGLVLGSFFWAMMLFQIPAGSLAEKIGGKYIVSACLLVSSLCSFATPYVTDFHVIWFILLRFLLGIFQAGIFPAAFGMICNWAPLSQKSFFFAMLDAGSYLGSVCTFFCSGFLTLAFGWPMLFFFPATIAAVVFIFSFITTSEPQDHPCISQQELDLIESDLAAVKEEKKVDEVQNTPWFAIFTNPAVNAATFIKFAIGWNFAVFYLEMPKYLNEIIHEEIRSNGEINAAVNLLTGVTMMLSGSVSEKIIERGYLSRIATRKFFSCFSCLGYGLMMLLIPAVGCDSYRLKAIMLTCATLAGFQGGSDLPLASEMSKNYPATIYAIVNNIALGAGFLVPVYTGIILSDCENQFLGWSILFYSSCCISICAFIFFLFFASCERQEFDFTPEELAAREKEREAQNLKFPSHRGWVVD